MANECLAALRVGNVDLAASTNDMMAEIVGVRNHITKLGENYSPPPAPILSPSKTISASKVALLAAEATPVMTATWSRFMEVHIGYLEQHGRLTPVKSGGIV